MARTRPNPPVIHMIVAIVVVLAPALLAVAWFQRVPDAPVAKVDPAPVIAAAQAAQFPIAVPSKLPEGWVCTRARWTPLGKPGLSGAYAAGNTAGLGYLSPDRVYFAVDQSDAAPEVLISDVTRRGRPDGTSSLGERTWTRYVSDDGRTRALALISDGRVTIVSADTGYPAIEAFATTLTWSGQA